MALIDKVMKVKTYNEMQNYIEFYANKINDKIKKYPPKKMMMEYNVYLNEVIKYDLEIDPPEELNEFKELMYWYYSSGQNKGFADSLYTRNYEYFKKDFYKTEKVYEEHIAFNRSKILPFLKRKIRDQKVANEIYEIIMDGDDISGAWLSIVENFDNVKSDLSSNMSDEDLEVLLEMNKVNIMFEPESIIAAQEAVTDFLEYILKNSFN